MSKNNQDLTVEHGLGLTSGLDTLQDFIENDIGSHHVDTISATTDLVNERSRAQEPQMHSGSFQTEHSVAHEELAEKMGLGINNAVSDYSSLEGLGCRVNVTDTFTSGEQPSLISLAQSLEPPPTGITLFFSYLTIFLRIKFNKY